MSKGRFAPGRKSENKLPLGSVRIRIETNSKKPRAWVKVAEPNKLTTITGGGNHHAEVRCFLMQYNGTDQDPQLSMPLHTVTTKARFGLVTVTIAGQEYAVVDIGMRMLAPHELFRAQGFGPDYLTNTLVNGKPLTKEAQIRLVGNSVCPPVAEALVRAQFQERASEAAG